MSNECPRSFQFRKENIDGIVCLSVHFIREIEDESSNWSYAASASVKLLSFNKCLKYSKERFIAPRVFGHKLLCVRTNLIEWEKLFDIKYGFVHNDLINFRIKIKVANRNDEDKSDLKFHFPRHCCDNSNNATFQLEIENVATLVAVKMPTFFLQNSSWHLSVYRRQSDYLGIRLKSDDDNMDGVTCEVNVTVKLTSSRENVDAIECHISEAISWERADIGRIVPWNRLFDAKYGFVTNNSITMIVEVRVDKSKGDIMSATKCQALAAASENPKLLQLKCTICLEKICNQEVSSASCGHPFCTTCIRESLKHSKVCPLCSARIAQHRIRHIYLPM